MRWNVALGLIAISGLIFSCSISKSSRKPNFLPAREISYEVISLKDRNILVASVISNGVRKYTEEDIIIEEKIGKKDNTKFWSKSILLDEQFAVGASIYRRKEHAGLGLWAKRTDEKGFSWEWFNLDKESEERNIYRKLQGSGEIKVTFKEIDDSKEISKIIFNSDIIFRYMGDPESKSITHLIVIRKGSVMDFYSQFESALGDTSNENKRFHLNIQLTKSAIEAGELEKAKSYAEELLKQASQFREDKRYGEALHRGYVTLGRLAFMSGDLQKAKDYLITAADSVSGLQLSSLQPDTTLVKMLLENAETDVVTQYFQLSKSSWKIGHDRLNGWIKVIQEGDIPIFDLNIEEQNIAIFTTGINEKQRPVDNIEDIALSEDKVYIFTYWHSITNEEHEYKCKIYDGTGKIVLTNQINFTPHKNSYHTWTWRTFNKYTDKPGNWKFEIFLDGKKVIEKSLVVLNRDEKPYDPSQITNFLKQHKIIKQSIAKYKSLQGYQDSTIVEMHMKMPGMDNKFNVPFLFAFDRPNRIRIETKFMPMADMTIISDGDTLVNYMARWNQYTKDNAPETFSQIESNKANQFAGYFQNIMLSPVPERELLEHVTELVELGQEEIDGMLVTVIELTQPIGSLSSTKPPFKVDLDKPIKIKIWIGNQDYLVRKIAYTLNLKELAQEMPEERRRFMPTEMSMIERHKSIRLNPTFTKDFFVFVPPEDAKLVDQFGPPTKREMDKAELVGKPASEFVLKDLDNSEVSLAEFKGKVLIVDFWATWCKPCIEQMPTYVSLQSQYQSQGFTIIGISTDETADVVRKFAAKHRLNFPLLMADEKVKRDYGGISVIPTIFVIDKNGMVRYVYKGSPPDKLVFQKHVEELLAEPITTPVDTIESGKKSGLVEEKEASFLSLLEKGESEFRKDFKEQDFSVSVKYLEEAVKIRPENQEVHYFLGYTYERLSAKDGSQMLSSNLELTKKSSAYFKRVIEIAPKYEGEFLISDPYSKLTAIWGSMAMAYLSRGQVDSAKWAFKYGQSEGGYFPAILEFNKNIMRSCEKNAILFTNGDNDTYPIWFLQLVEGYRNDITIINLSLLNTHWYVKQLKNAYPFGLNNIDIRLSVSSIDTLAAKYWSEKTVEIPAPEDKLNHERKVIWTVKPTLMGNAIRVQDLMLIHIIKSNEWERPIYFSTTLAPQNKIGLEEYLTLEGLIYRLMSHKINRYSKDHLYKNCFENYTFDGIHDKHLKYSQDVNSLYRNYHSVFVSLATAFYDDGEIDKAKSCIKTMTQKIPEEVVPYGSERFKERLKFFEKQLSLK